MTNFDCIFAFFLTHGALYNQMSGNMHLGHCNNAYYGDDTHMKTPRGSGAVCKCLSK